MVADGCQKEVECHLDLMEKWTEVFGRLVFTTQAVEHVKPLLGPLIAWTAAVRSGALVELPLRVRLVSNCRSKIAWDVSRSRVEVSIAIVFKERKNFRANARAEATTRKQEVGKRQAQPTRRMLAGSKWV